MKTTQDRVVDWIRGRAEREFAQDVALVLLYGSYVNQTSHRLSDVDCYFIPATDRGYAMAKTFIVDGVGYDVFPMGWDRVGRIADLQEPLSPLVGDARILYARSPSDVARFEMLKERMLARLADRAYRHGIAIDRLRRAAERLDDASASLDLHTARKHAGACLLHLADAIVLDGGTYFHRGLKRHFEDLAALPDLPAGFLENYDAAVRAKNTLDLDIFLQSALNATARFLGAPVPKVRPISQEQHVPAIPDPDELVSFYEELLSSINKIRVNAEQGEWRMAFVNGCNLAREIDGVCREFGFPPLPFLDAYDAADLTALRDRVDKVDKELAGRIETYKPIPRHPDFDSFLLSMK